MPSLAVACALVVGGLSSVSTPLAAAAPAALTGPPGLPVPLEAPDDPIVAPTSAGYLPGSSSVTPTGDFTYSIALDVPAGRAGMAPRLALSYASSGQNGLFGVGWDLVGMGSSIARCGKARATEGTVTGVVYDQSDRFCLGGRKLIAVGAVNGGTGGYGQNNTEYRTETDSFSQVISVGTPSTIANGPDSFIVRTKDGRVRTYEARTGTRVKSAVTFVQIPPLQAVNSTSSPRVAWLLTKEVDRSGNEIRYEYSPPAAQSGVLWQGSEYQLDRIQYTYGNGVPASRWVQFEYEDRNDKEFYYQGGVRYRQHNRVKAVSMYAPNPAATELVWKYTLGYKYGNSGRSLLTSVTKCGPSGVCLKAKQFGWHDPAVAPAFGTTTLTDEDFIPFGAQEPRGSGGNTAKGEIPLEATVADYDGDGTDDLIYTIGGHQTVHTADPANEQMLDLANYFVRRGTRSVSAASPLAAKQQLTQTMYAWPGSAGSGVQVQALRPVDLDGDGAAEIGYGGLYGSAATQKTLRWNNLSGLFVDTGEPGVTPGQIDYGDVNADGRIDRIRRGEAPNSAFTVSLNQNGTWAAPGATQVSPVSSAGSCQQRIGDVDGDGRAELITRNTTYVNGKPACGAETVVLKTFDTGASTGTSGTTWIGATPYHYVPPADAATWRELQLGDFNGDGLQDAIRLPKDPTTPGYRLWNTGVGLVVDGTVDVPRDVLNGVRVADVNRDGRDDLVSFHHTALSVNADETQVTEGAGGHDVISVLLSDGKGGFARTDYNIDAGTPDPKSGWATSNVGDFNGDGLVDLAKVTDDRLTVMTQQPSFADRLWTVRDEGTGWDRETVGYSTAWADDLSSVDNNTCSYPRVCVRRGLVVVRWVDSRAHFVDPASGAAPNRKVYSYGQPYADARRGFLGFSTVRTWDPQRAAETVTEFDNVTTVNGGKYFPFIMRPKVVTSTVAILDQAQLAGKPSHARAQVTRIRATDEARVTNGGTIYTTVPQQSSTMMWEEEDVTIAWAQYLGGAAPEHITGILEPATPLRRTDETFAVDGFGNRTGHTSDTAGGTRLEQVTGYDNRVGDWLITLPTTQAVTSFNADRTASVTRRSENHYDTLGRPDVSYQERDNPDPMLRMTTTYGYNGNGLPVTASVAAPGLPTRVTHTEYDPMWPGQPDEKIHPSQLWSEHDQAAYRPSTWTMVHPAYGVTAATEDANGVVSTSVHDEFGRLIEARPAGAATTSYGYAPRQDSAGGTNGTVTTATTVGITKTSTTDALGRAIGSTATGFGGSVAASTTKYDPLGRVVSQTSPAPGGTTGHAYDTLDRELTTTLPDGKTIGYAHAVTAQESVVTTTDPRGDKKELHHDRNGRLASSVELLKLSASTSEAVTTGYRYAPFDRADQVTDDAGHQTTMWYDTLGRRHQIDDPDAGITVSTHYGTGDLYHEYNAAGGHFITNAYDDLGRKVQSITEDGVSTFAFDTAPHGIGNPAWATSPDSIKTAFRYDAFGRAAGTDYIDLGNGGATYSTNIGYDNAGRQTSLTYPQAGPAGTSRFALQYDYNTHGHLGAVRYAAVGQPALLDLWNVTARTPNQALDTATLDTTAGSIKLDLGYENPTGRLDTIDATHQPSTGTPTTLLHLGYDYYPDGQLSDRVQSGLAGASTEHYSYDSLNRLIGWMLIPSNNDERNTGYGYDTIGNLTAIDDDHGLAQTRGYGKANGAQPHTLTSLTSGGTTTAYGYDSKGRQVSGGGRGNITYNWHNLPKKVTRDGRDTTFAYDAHGQKVKETRPDGSTTFYVPGLYERRDTRAGTSHVFYVNTPDGPIAQATYNGAGTTVEYHLTDGLGSVVATASTSGAITQTLRFDPWGARLNPDGTPFTGTTGPTTKGFTYHEHDDPLGLINMNGRYYDPLTTRFLTPDPVVSDPTASQAWNPYSYVRNNPTNRVDPTGHRDGAAWSTGFDASPPGFAEGGLFDYYGSSAESRGSGSAWPDIAAMVWWWNRHSQNSGANSPGKADETGAKPSAVSSNPTANGPDAKSMLRNIDLAAGLRPDCNLFCEDSLALADGDGTAGLQTPEEATGQTPPPSAADYAKYGAISLGGAVAAWGAATVTASGYAAAAALCMRNVIACVNLPSVLYALAGIPGGPSATARPIPKGLPEAMGWLAKAKGEPAQLAYELAKRLTVVKNNSGWWSYNMDVAKTGEYLFYGSGRVIVVGAKGNWIGPIEAKVVDGLGFVVNYDILKRLQ